MKFGVIPDKFETFLRMMMQAYSGPITIWPIPSWRDFYKIFKLPDDDDI